MGTVCSGDSRNPLPRDTAAMPAPLILDAFAHTSPLLMPLTRVPARGELITLVVCLALGEQRKEVVSASQPPWSCALSSGSAVPKELRVEFEGVIESIQSHMAALFFLAKAAKD